MNKPNKLRLIELIRRQDHEKYPNVPDHMRPIIKVSDSDANSLTQCVIRFLKLNGHQAERISNTGRYIDDSKVVKDATGRERKIGSGKYIPGQGTNGTADISATIRGRSVKIEIKYGADRQSDAQKVYQANIEQAGGVYLIVREFDLFIEWYDQFIQQQLDYETFYNTYKR